MFTAQVISSANREIQTQREHANAKIKSIRDHHFDVVVIGAGISGAAAVYHLATNRHGGAPTSILLVDHGEIGAGSHDRFVAKPNVALPAMAPYRCAGEGLGDEKAYHPGNSGGVIFSKPHFLHGPGCLKMTVQLYPSTTPNFIVHHGTEGARRYLRLAALGVEIQKRLAKTVIEKVECALEETGSVLCADQSCVDDLEEEYALLKSLGCEDIELWGEERMNAVHGATSGFVRGIYFPKDARIDALVYVQALVKAATHAAEYSKQTSLTVIEYSPTVHDVFEDGKEAVISFANGVCIRSDQAVLATNGLFLSKELAGILRPCWSYFVALPHPRDPLVHDSKADTSRLNRFGSAMGGISSLNFFTYGFTHDWCVTNGVLRISGADHFSALKPPRAGVRSHCLASWCLERYPYMKHLLPNDQMRTVSNDPSQLPAWLKGRYVYGVYAETPDMVPLVGKLCDSSRICYLLGCNAWGQASLSFAASLVPALLGYSKLTPEQAELADFLAISRFKTLSYYSGSTKAKL